MEETSFDHKDKHNSNNAGKFLTFAMGKEEFGLEILKVREIIGYMDITAIPRAPHYVKGVINLRGQVISVVDLRANFGMEKSKITDQTCIIVVEILQNGVTRNVGLIVDRVSEVLSISRDHIEKAPSFSTTVETDFILGMGRVNNGVKILLDIDKVLDSSDVQLVQ
jgi:purine-binding chemotaxis protein CheW